MIRNFFLSFSLFAFSLFLHLQSMSFSYSSLLNLSEKIGIFSYSWFVWTGLALLEVAKHMLIFSLAYSIYKKRTGQTLAFIPLVLFFNAVSFYLAITGGQDIIFTQEVQDKSTMETLISDDIDGKEMRIDNQIKRLDNEVRGLQMNVDSMVNRGHAQYLITPKQEEIEQKNQEISRLDSTLEAYKLQKKNESSEKQETIKNSYEPLKSEIFWESIGLELFIVITAGSSAIFAFFTVFDAEKFPSLKRKKKSKTVEIIEQEEKVEQLEETPVKEKTMKEPVFEETTLSKSEINNLIIKYYDTLGTFEKVANHLKLHHHIIMDKSTVSRRYNKLVQNNDAKK